MVAEGRTMKIYDLVPDAEIITRLAAEELAYQLLLVAQANLQHGIVHRNVVINLNSQIEQQTPYTQQQRQEVEIAVMEALHWLEVNGLLIPASGVNGTNGFRVFSRRGRDVLDRGRFDDYQRAAAFPRTLLHPAIADRVWLSLARGELDAAVFFAFRQVEEAVRKAGGYSATDIGIHLMRRAFDTANGPLTDQGQPQSEREALSHLFVGAIGSYKNPHSHRTVTIADHGEAQEMVMLASHLLRIVDGRPVK
jgi:uncharacterized protein (TIGR02391 family)